MLGYEHSLLLVDWHRCTTVVKRAYNISGDSSGNISVSDMYTRLHDAPCNGFKSPVWHWSEHRHYFIF